MPATIGHVRTIRVHFAAVGAAALTAGGTAAASPESSVLPCTSNQFTSELVYGDAGAGNRYAAIQLTGKEGECPAGFR